MVTAHCPRFHVLELGGHSMLPGLLFGWRQLIDALNLGGDGEACFDVLQQPKSTALWELSLPGSSFSSSHLTLVHEYFRFVCVIVQAK